MITFEALRSPPKFDSWDEVHALLTLCFGPMEGRIDPPSSLNRMTAPSIATQARQHDFVVVVSDGTVVGFGLGEPRGETLYVSKLAVHPDQRGHGLARQIIELFKDVARQHDLSALSLQTRVELIENHLTFHALGFQKTGETRHPGYDRVTSFTFTASL